MDEMVVKFIEMGFLMEMIGRVIEEIGGQNFIYLFLCVILVMCLCCLLISEMLIICRRKFRIDDDF